MKDYGINLSLMDVWNKCRELQDTGINITFTSAFGRITVEHRNSEDCELIAGFEIRDTTNQAMLNAVFGYLDSIMDSIRRGTIHHEDYHEKSPYGELQDFQRLHD